MTSRTEYTNCGEIDNDDEDILDFTNKVEKLFDNLDNKLVSYEKNSRSFVITKDKITYMIKRNYCFFIKIKDNDKYLAGFIFNEWIFISEE